MSGKDAGGTRNCVSTDGGLTGVTGPERGMEYSNDRKSMLSSSPGSGGEGNGGMVIARGWIIGCMGCMGGIDCTGGEG